MSVCATAIVQSCATTQQSRDARTGPSRVAFSCRPRLRRVVTRLRLKLVFGCSVCAPGERHDRMGWGRRRRAAVFAALCAAGSLHTHRLHAARACSTAALRISHRPDTGRGGLTVAARQGRNGAGCVVIGGKGGHVDAGESGRRRAHQGIGRCKAGEGHTKLLLLLLLLVVR